MRLAFAWKVHRDDCLPEREAERQGPLYVLHFVEVLEVLEIGLKLHWNRRLHYFVTWPVCCRKHLTAKVKGKRGSLLLIIAKADLFGRLQVVNHALNLVELLEPASDLEISDQPFFVLNVLAFFR